MRLSRSYITPALGGLLIWMVSTQIHRPTEKRSLGEVGLHEQEAALSAARPFPANQEIPGAKLRLRDEISSSRAAAFSSTPTPRSEEPRTTPNPKADLSWFYTPQFDREFSVSDQRYDGVVLSEAEYERDHANSWRETTFRRFNTSDVFFAQIRPLKDPLRVIELRIKLKRRAEGNSLLPEWIQFAERGKVETERESMIRLDRFASRFSDQEVYVGLLAFPYDFHWRQIEPKSPCDEIALIYDALISHEDLDTITGFDGRIFCRTGLRDLRGIAHFSASRTK
jgi:hypothetical protein